MNAKHSGSWSGECSPACYYCLSLGTLSGTTLAAAQEGVPAPASGRSRETQTRQLHLEERADIFMARKSYDDAVTYYYRALKQTNSTNAVLWNKLGIAYQQMENFQAAPSHTASQFGTRGTTLNHSITWEPPGSCKTSTGNP